MQARSVLHFSLTISWISFLNSGFRPSSFFFIMIFHFQLSSVLIFGLETNYRVCKFITRGTGLEKNSLVDTEASILLDSWVRVPVSSSESGLDCLVSVPTQKLSALPRTEKESFVWRVFTQPVEDQCTGLQCPLCKDQQLLEKVWPHRWLVLFLLLTVKKVLSLSARLFLSVSSFALYIPCVRWACVVHLMLEWPQRSNSAFFPPGLVLPRMTTGWCSQFRV